MATAHTRGAYLRNIVIFISYSPVLTPPRSIHGQQYCFVTVKLTEFFGLTQVWVTKQQSVMISDKERTILDALRQPQYAGGIPEVAKALWMSRTEIKIPQLLGYVQHFSSGALRRRLGFRLELYAIVSRDQLKPLRSSLTSTYDRLDLTLPKPGPFQARWRLQLNIGIDELKAIPHTWIPQRNISVLANRLDKNHGGRRVPEAVLEQDCYRA
jgi:predicted transcriptional regulator of viral defense system